MKYCITTRENNGKLTNYYFDKLEVNQFLNIKGKRFKVKAIGVKLKQQPVTHQYFFDLDENFITCLQYKSEDGLRYKSFKFTKYAETI